MHGKRKVKENSAVNCDLQSPNTMSSGPEEPKLVVTQFEKINTPEPMPEASKQGDIKSEDAILEERRMKKAESMQNAAQDVITNDATTSQEISTTEDITKAGDQPTASSSISVSSSIDENTTTPSRATPKYSKDATLKKNAGVEFVNTIFSRHQQLTMTDELMSSLRIWSLRIWSLRFDANCEDILRNPDEP